MKRTLILVRHCQSDWNAAHRLSGQDNTAKLSELGKQQAKNAALKLSELRLPIWRVFSSDLDRARETADEIAAACGGVPTRIDSRLREVHLGCLDGHTRSQVEVLKGGDELLASLRKNNYDFTEFEGENVELVLARQLAVVEEAFASCKDTRTVIFVGHGTSLRTLLRHFDKKRDLHEQGKYDIVEF